MNKNTETFITACESMMIVDECWDEDQVELTAEVIDSMQLIQTCPMFNNIKIPADSLKVIMESSTELQPFSFANESKITAAERKALKDEDFGLPGERKYPLIDKEHVSDSMAYFHFCPEEKRKELATNIMKRYKELKMDSKISEKSLLRKYVTIPE